MKISLAYAYVFCTVIDHLMQGRVVLNIFENSLQLFFNSDLDTLRIITIRLIQSSGMS